MTNPSKGENAQLGYDPADLLDIPGTTIFTSASSRRAYQLHRFCMSLMKAENRVAFKSGERRYLENYSMTPNQREAVLVRDYNRMIALGGNIYFLAKLGSTDGWSFQKIAGSMTGLSVEEYAKMMVDGGRSPDGNRSITGRY